MRWEVEWSYSFKATLGRIRSLDDAQRVCAAILRLAETGQGDVFKLPDDDELTVRLRVGSYRVRLSLDRTSGVLCAWTVFRVP